MIIAVRGVISSIPGNPTSKAINSIDKKSSKSRIQLPGIVVAQIVAVIVANCSDSSYTV